MKDCPLKVELDILSDIRSNNALAPDKCQAITQTNVTHCQLDPQEQTSVKF